MLLTTSVGFVFFLLQPEMMPMEKMPSDKNKNTNEGDSVCLIVYKGIIVENKDTILYGNLNAKWLVFISASGSACTRGRWVIRSHWDPTTKSTNTMA